MKVVLLFPEKLKPNELASVQQLYLKRLRAMTSLELIHYKEEKVDSRKAVDVKNAEAKRILKTIKEQDFLLICDEHGKQLTSMSLADLFKQAFSSSGPFTAKKRLIILIGGALGLADTIKQRANYTMALSSLTMAGGIARITLLEAIYRAICINNNHPYHNQ